MINNSILEAALGQQSYMSSCSYDEALYLELRRLFVLTYGDHNWTINKQISRYRPIRSPLSSASRGLVHSSEIQSAVASLFRSGYFVTSIDLPPAYYLELISLIKSKSSDFRSSSARRFLDEWNELSTSSLIQALLSDLSIKYIADQYLRCNSILNSIRAWNTTHKPRGKHNTSADAMKFHFDSDHNRFLKVFLYLDNVNHLNGPHIFVPYTNMFYRRSLHPSMQVDGRISDCTVLKHGFLPNFLTGPRGTLIFADTHNLHRGAPVSANSERNILQLQFVDSLFGAKPQFNDTEINEINYSYP